MPPFECSTVETSQSYPAAVYTPPSRQLNPGFHKKKIRFLTALQPPPPADPQTRRRAVALRHLWVRACTPIRPPARPSTRQYIWACAGLTKLSRQPRIHIYVYTHVDTHIHTHVCTHVHSWVYCMSIYKSIHMSVQMCVYMSLDVSVAESVHS